MSKIPLFSALLLAAPLTACNTTSGVDTHVVTNNVPVPVYCVKRSDILTAPPKVHDQIASAASASAAADLVGASAVDLRSWGTGLYNQLLACADPKDTSKVTPWEQRDVPTQAQMDAAHKAGEP